MQQLVLDLRLQPGKTMPQVGNRTAERKGTVRHKRVVRALLGARKGLAEAVLQISRKNSGMSMRGHMPRDPGGCSQNAVHQTTVLGPQQGALIDFGALVHPPAFTRGPQDLHGDIKDRCHMIQHHLPGVNGTISPGVHRGFPPLSRQHDVVNTREFATIFACRSSYPPNGIQGRCKEATEPDPALPHEQGSQQSPRAQEQPQDKFQAGIAIARDDQERFLGGLTAQSACFGPPLRNEMRLGSTMGSVHGSEHKREAALAGLDKNPARISVEEQESSITELTD